MPDSVFDLFRKEMAMLSPLMVGDLKQFPFAFCLGTSYRRKCRPRHERRRVREVSTRAKSLLLSLVMHASKHER